MREAEVDALVLRLVEEVVPWQVGKRGIAADSSLGGDLGIDSLGLVTLAFRIGEELGFEIEEGDVDLAAIVTVGDAQAATRELLERQNERV